MSITLTYLSTTIDLDPDLQWSDEFSWQAVEQTAQRSVTGAMIVQTRQRVGGRPITLQPSDDSSAWMTRETLNAVREWAQVAGRQMTLTLRGVSRTVIFRHHDGNSIEATPVVDFSDPDDTDHYRVTLRFLEI